jgi:hypothetical protein
VKTVSVWTARDSSQVLNNSDAMGTSARETLKQILPNLRLWQTPMAITMRLIGRGHGVYADQVDYTIFCGAWCVGRIFETRTGPQGLPFFWSMDAPSKPSDLS